MTKKEPPITHDDEWGEDWEAAFKAEDQMFSASGEEAAEQGDTGAESGGDDTNSPYEFTPEELDLDDIPDLDEDAAGQEITAAEPQDEASTSVASPSVLAAAVQKLSGFRNSLSQRLSRVTVTQWLLSGCGSFLFIITSIAVYNFISLNPPPAIIVPEQQESQAGHPSVAQVPSGTATLNEAPQDGPASPAPAIQEKIRQKWSFPSFFIPVSTPDADRKITFISIDLYLVILVEQGQSPPDEKRGLVRDIIYKFYLNQKLDDLHRYSLARGEMNRKLRAWISKQYPELELQAIAFDRYQVG